MKLRELCEEFVDGVLSKRNKKYYEIFKNPTNKEILSMEEDSYNRRRYIIDFINKDVYMFHPELLHEEAVKKLGLSKEYKRLVDDYVFGVASGSKIPLKISERDFTITLDGRFKLKEIKNHGKHDWIFKFFSKDIAI